MEKSCSVATLPEISTEIIKLGGSGCSRSGGDQLLIRKLSHRVDTQPKTSSSDFNKMQELSVLSEELNTRNKLKIVGEILACDIALIYTKFHKKKMEGGLFTGVAQWCCA